MCALQVAQQIRAAQQKAALSGQAPLAWAIGARCQAIWSGDGGWYNGTISGVSVNNRFIVTFDEDGGVEEVRRDSGTLVDVHRRLQRIGLGGHRISDRSPCQSNSQEKRLEVSLQPNQADK